MITASASVSPAMTWAFSQVPHAAATACASSRRSTRRNVDRDGGTRRPRRSVHAPSAASTSAGTSDDHSLIAVTESAPASTVATANAITTAARCRIPCRRRGPGTSARQSSKFR